LQHHFVAFGIVGAIDECGDSGVFAPAEKSRASACVGVGSGNPQLDIRGLDVGQIAVGVWGGEYV
jgi:hypothetical protein